MAFSAFAATTTPTENKIPTDPKQYVFLRLQEEKIDSKIVNKVIQCESNWNPNAVGDKGTSFGIWQIHLPAHPNITKKQAIDVIYSTEYAIKLINSARSWKHWSCYKGK